MTNDQRLFAEQLRPMVDRMGSTALAAVWLDVRALWGRLRPSSKPRRCSPARILPIALTAARSTPAL